MKPASLTLLALSLVTILTSCGDSTNEESFDTDSTVVAPMDMPDDMMAAPAATDTAMMNSDGSMNAGAPGVDGHGTLEPPTPSTPTTTTRPQPKSKPKGNDGSGTLDPPGPKKAGDEVNY